MKLSELNNVEKGVLGEKIARKYLESKGIKLISLNYRNRFGEIDIIGRLNRQIIFVEVKSRTSDRFGLPCEAVDFRKVNKIKNLARHYILTNKLIGFDVRFDVVEVYFSEKKINHIEDAF